MVVTRIRSSVRSGSDSPTNAAVVFQPGGSLLKVRTGLVVRVCALVAAAWCAGVSSVRAQTASDPNPGNLTLTAGIDYTSAYLFRGIPQDDTGVILWPYGDLGIALHHGDGWLKALGVNVGMWNSLHTGVAGTDGLGKLW